MNNPPGTWSPAEAIKTSSLWWHVSSSALPMAAMIVLARPAWAAELRSAEDVRRLTPEQAEQHIAVRLRGVVTFYDPAVYSRFVQDETAGIYLQDTTNLPALNPGQMVEVEGETSSGEYAPVIVPKSIKVVGDGQLPIARPVTLEELVSGREDSQFVEVSGIVRSVRFEEESANYLIDLTMGEERLTAYAKQLPVAQTEQLVESTVKVRGVCSTLFNRLRQLFGFRLLVPRPEDLVIEKPASTHPFDMPTQSISSLLQFTPQGTFARRVKVAGTVIYSEPGSAVFIQDEKEGLYCQTRDRSPLVAGDEVEVLGFPAKGEYNPILQDAVYRKVRSGAWPKPAHVGLDEVLAGTNDCRLVRMNARLLEHAQRGREQFIVLQNEGFVFHAFLARDTSGEGLAPLQTGSEVAVTGICLIERGSGWRAGEGWRAKSFRLLLRSPEDVTVLSLPPWWTPRKIAWAAGALAVVAIAAFAWVGLLRRRVQHQTGTIRKQLETEATLKARYEELFENANDMVFTHDLSGRVTSINKTGERLLQHRREGVISRSVLDLVAEDHRAAARSWLDQVIKGAEVPPTEWDFVNASGQRIKLEISSRLIEQNGRGAEVESIARDVTERRRLERELLEISNREQRRIGHDLHDGVCQQLAAATYMADILGDQLRGKEAPEAAGAERIAGMINEANSQARNVARGLFPARLEEHGLSVALEELAANASSRYRITCRFVGETAPQKLDSELALHLYYIAQESVLNAVKHGKATSVIVKLSAEGDRMKLSVQDNGAGFDLSHKTPSGMGILIMRYRAKMIGATLDVRSEPGHGTEINCWFAPLVRENPVPERTAAA